MWHVHFYSSKQKEKSVVGIPWHHLGQHVLNSMASLSYIELGYIKIS